MFCRIHEFSNDLSFRWAVHAFCELSHRWTFSTRRSYFLWDVIDPFLNLIIRAMHLCNSLPFPQRFFFGGGGILFNFTPLNTSYFFTHVRLPYSNKKGYGCVFHWKELWQVVFKGQIIFSYKIREKKW